MNPVLCQTKYVTLDLAEFAMCGLKGAKHWAQCRD